MNLVSKCVQATGTMADRFADYGGSIPSIGCVPIAYDDSYRAWSTVESRLAGRMPLRDIHLASGQNATASINQLNAIFLPSDDVEFQYSESPINWYRQPYAFVLVFVREVRTDEFPKAAIETWIERHKAQRNEWMILHVTNEPVSKFTDRQKLKLYGSDLKSLMSAAGKEDHSRVLQVDTNSHQISGAQKHDCWIAVLSRLAQCVAASLNAREARHLQHIQHSFADRMRSGWRFGQHFMLRESYAFVLEQVGRFDDALREYSSLAEDYLRLKTDRREYLERQLGQRPSKSKPIARRTQKASASASEGTCSSSDDESDSGEAELASVEVIPGVLNLPLPHTPACVPFQYTEAPASGSTAYSSASGTRKGPSPAAELCTGGDYSDVGGKHGPLGSHWSETKTSVVTVSCNTAGSWLSAQQALSGRYSWPHTLDTTQKAYRHFIYTGDVAESDLLHYMFARQCHLLLRLERPAAVAKLTLQYLETMHELLQQQVHDGTLSVAHAAVWRFCVAMDMVEACQQRHSRAQLQTDITSPHKRIRSTPSRKAKAAGGSQGQAQSGHEGGRAGTSGPSITTSGPDIAAFAGANADASAAPSFTISLDDPPLDDHLPPDAADDHPADEPGPQPQWSDTAQVQAASDSRAALGGASMDTGASDLFSGREFRSHKQPARRASTTQSSSREAGGSAREQRARAATVAVGRRNRRASSEDHLPFPLDDAEEGGRGSVTDSDESDDSDDSGGSEASGGSSSVSHGSHADAAQLTEGQIEGQIEGQPEGQIEGGPSDDHGTAQESSRAESPRSSDNGQIQTMVGAGSDGDASDSDDDERFQVLGFSAGVGPLLRTRHRAQDSRRRRRRTASTLGSTSSDSSSDSGSILSSSEDEGIVVLGASRLYDNDGAEPDTTDTSGTGSIPVMMSESPISMFSSPSAHHEVVALGIPISELLIVARSELELLVELETPVEMLTLWETVAQQASAGQEEAEGMDDVDLDARGPAADASLPQEQGAQAKKAGDSRAGQLGPTHAEDASGRRANEEFPPTALKQTPAAPSRLSDAISVQGSGKDWRLRGWELGLLSHTWIPSPRALRLTAASHWIKQLVTTDITSPACEQLAEKFALMQVFWGGGVFAEAECRAVLRRVFEMRPILMERLLDVQQQPSTAAETESGDGGDGRDETDDFADGGAPDDAGESIVMSHAALALRRALKSSFAAARLFEGITTHTALHLEACERYQHAFTWQLARAAAMVRWGHWEAAGRLLHQLLLRLHRHAMGRSGGADGGGREHGGWRALSPAAFGGDRAELVLEWSPTVGSELAGAASDYAWYEQPAQGQGARRLSTHDTRDLAKAMASSSRSMRFGSYELDLNQCDKAARLSCTGDMSSAMTGGGRATMCILFSRPADEAIRWLEHQRHQQRAAWQVGAVTSGFMPRQLALSALSLLACTQRATDDEAGYVSSALAMLHPAVSRESRRTFACEANTHRPGVHTTPESLRTWGWLSGERLDDQNISLPGEAMGVSLDGRGLLLLDMLTVVGAQTAACVADVIPSHAVEAEDGSAVEGKKLPEQDNPSAASPPQLAPVEFAHSCMPYIQAAAGWRVPLPSNDPPGSDVRYLHAPYPVAVPRGFADSVTASDLPDSAHATAIAAHVRTVQCRIDHVELLVTLESRLPAPVQLDAVDVILKAADTTETGSPESDSDSHPTSSTTKRRTPSHGSNPSLGADPSQSPMKSPPQHPIRHYASQSAQIPHPPTLGSRPAPHRRIRHMSHRLMQAAGMSVLLHRVPSRHADGLAHGARRRTSSAQSLASSRGHHSNAALQASPDHFGEVEGSETVVVRTCQAVTLPGNAEVRPGDDTARRAITVLVRVALNADPDDANGTAINDVCPSGTETPGVVQANGAVISGCLHHDAPYAIAELRLRLGRLILSERRPLALLEHGQFDTLRGLATALVIEPPCFPAAVTLMPLPIHVGRLAAACSPPSVPTAATLAVPAGLWEGQLQLKISYPAPPCEGVQALPDGHLTMRVPRWIQLSDTDHHEACALEPQLPNEHSLRLSLSGITDPSTTAKIGASMLPSRRMLAMCLRQLLHSDVRTAPPFIDSHSLRFQVQAPRSTPASPPTSSADPPRQLPSDTFSGRQYVSVFSPVRVTGNIKGGVTTQGETADSYTATIQLKIHNTAGNALHIEHWQPVLLHVPLAVYPEAGHRTRARTGSSHSHGPSNPASPGRGGRGKSRPTADPFMCLAHAVRAHLVEWQAAGTPTPPPSPMEGLGLRVVDTLSRGPTSTTCLPCAQTLSVAGRVQRAGGKVTAATFWCPASHRHASQQAQRAASDASHSPEYLPMLALSLAVRLMDDSSLRLVLPVLL